MNNRQEYLKKYRLENKEKYREYQRKYRKNHLSTYEKLQQENQKYKKVIDKANNWVRSYMDEWSINDEVWQELNELLILLEEVE